MAMNTVFSVGPGVFTDEEFARAVGEISVPDLEGWELFAESMGTTIYRKYKEVACVCVWVFLQVLIILQRLRSHSHIFRSLDFMNTRSWV